MAGLDRPTSGEVRIDGAPIQAMSEDQLALLRRHKIGFVFQSFQLLGNLTARENVLLPIELLGLPDPVAPRRRAARRRRPRRPRPPLPEPALGRRAAAGRPRARLRRPAADPARRRAHRQPRRRHRPARSWSCSPSCARREGTTLVLVTHDPGGRRPRRPPDPPARRPDRARRGGASLAVIGAGGGAGVSLGLLLPHPAPRVARLARPAGLLRRLPGGGRGRRGGGRGPLGEPATTASAARPASSSPPTSRCGATSRSRRDLDGASPPFPGAQRTDVKETVTVAAAPGGTAGPGPASSSSSRWWTASIRSTASWTCSPARPLPRAADARHGRGRLGAAGPPGAARWATTLQIGGQPFRIAGSRALRARPGQHLADPGAAGLPLGRRARPHRRSRTRGSRIGYRALFRLPDGISTRRARRRPPSGCAGAPRRRLLPGRDLPRRRSRRCGRTSRGSSASSGWWPCCRSSSAASASPRACAPGSPAGSTPSPSSSAWGCARARSSRSTSGQTVLLGLAGSLVGIARRRGRAARPAAALPRPDPGRADPPLAAGGPAARPGLGVGVAAAVQPAAALRRAAGAAGAGAAPRRRAPPPPPLGHGGDPRSPWRRGSGGWPRCSRGSPRAGGAVHRRRGGGDGGARRRRLPGLLGGPPAAARRPSSRPAALAAPRPRRPRPPRRRGERRHRRPGARRARRPRHVARRAAASPPSSSRSCRTTRRAPSWSTSSRTSGRASSAPPAGGGPGDRVGAGGDGARLGDRRRHRGGAARAERRPRE